MLKLWGRGNSVNVQKVLWTIAEIGIEVERINAGMDHGIVNEPWFAEINPNRLVPAIDDDGVVLWESNVIVRYLAAKHAAGTLMPADNATRARAEMWMDWQQSIVMPGLGPVFVGLVRTPAERRNMPAISNGVDVVKAALHILDHHLADRPYIMGGNFTVADIPLGCAVYRWYALPVEHGDMPNLRAWYERLTKRADFAEQVMLPLT